MPVGSFLASIPDDKRWRDAQGLATLMGHDSSGDLIAQLGPHEMGKGRPSIKDVAVIDTNILCQMIRLGFDAKASD